jgi:sugar phosphate isomerase/epimerase
MMNRKDFLRSLGFLAVGATAIGCGRGRATYLPEKRKVVSVQLWSVNRLMNEQASQTLKGLADCGYLEVESFGFNNSKYFNIPIYEFSKMVKGYGMKLTSTHLPSRYNPENIQEGLDWWKEAADLHIAVGCDTLVIPSLPTLRGIPREVEWLGPVCEYINKLNDIAKARGMRAGFHNHDNDEVMMQNGEVILDYLIANTDPSFFIQLDNHNMMAAGRDPVGFLHQYKCRTQQLHVKDDDIVGASGRIDFKELFTVAAKYGIYEPIVEVENFPEGVSMMEAMRRSAEYLLNAPYVRFFGR